MAREICFCGWVGELEDREPVYAGDGEWGLGCPMCGHLDRLAGMVGGGPLLDIGQSGMATREHVRIEIG